MSIENKNEITFLRGARNKSKIHQCGKINVADISVNKYPFTLYIMKTVVGIKQILKSVSKSMSVLVSLAL